jgi:hypothetical protein
LGLVWTLAFAGLVEITSIQFILAPYPVARIQRQARRNRDGSAAICAGCASA